MRGAGRFRAPARNLPWPRRAGRAPWRARSRAWTGAPRSHGPIPGAWGHKCRAGEGAGRLAVREGLPDLRAEIVGSQALPYRLLRTGRDAERRHLARVLRMVK